MDDRKKVLVVDDEAQIIRVLRHILNAHGYAVRSAEDGEAALEVFSDWQPDLVVTDLQMPNIGGLELCKMIRKSSDIPIVVLSVRDDEKTIVQALDSGADDYVTKPFGTNELLARLRATFRRAPDRSASTFESGPFLVDTAGHNAELNGVKLKLTPKEFDLLACLIRHPEQVLTHSFLLRNVWGDYYSEQPEALRVLVGALRKKIEADPSSPKYLLTEPWIGYRFHPDAK